MTKSPEHAITLRRIGVDDWPVWRKLRLEALEEAPYAFGSTLAEWSGEGDTEMRWRGRLSTVPFNVVGDVNGIAAGMVSGTSPNQDGTIELISMWVAPFARRQGVADLLMTAVIEWAREQRAAKLILGVIESNKRAAAFYRRHLFVDIGAIDNEDSEIASERQMMLDLKT